MPINIIHREAVTNVFHIPGYTLGAILQGLRNKGILNFSRKKKENVSKKRNLCKLISVATTLNV